MTIGNPFNPWPLGHYSGPTSVWPSTPTWFLQQCPKCEGFGNRERRYALGTEDCAFCFGIGVVKVSSFSGSVEGVEPPKEPWWHEQKRIHQYCSHTPGLSCHLDERTGGDGDGGAGGE